jgi:poly-gamma-glutamate system protein
MKRLYWRPLSASHLFHGIACLVAIGALACLEQFETEARQPRFEQKQAAAELAGAAMEAVRDERLRRGIAIDREFDISGGGLIGRWMTPVTTNPGSLRAKQTSINPNFAAAVVGWLHEAGVQDGDAIAVELSGSFPALNICVLAAIETMKLSPSIVATAGASQWGANDPEFMWLDMESHLYEANILTHRSSAGSLGGLKDTAKGMPDNAKSLLIQAIRRNGLRLLEPEDFQSALDLRMSIHEDEAGGSPIRAYVSVGGGMASSGVRSGVFRPGLNLRAPRIGEDDDSVMVRMSRRGVPVIRLSRIEFLARQFGFPVCPDEIPPIGQGRVFIANGYSRAVASGGLAVIFAALLTARFLQRRVVEPLEEA